VRALFGERELTLKLPRARVDELVEASIGTRFDPGNGRLMKEWLTVTTPHVNDWEGLCDEALLLVRWRDTAPPWPDVQDRRLR
jgi:hypothetical protein